MRFAAKGDRGVKVDPVKPSRLISRTGRKLDSRAKTFDALKQAKEKSVTFENVVLNVGEGNQIMSINIGDIPVDADFIESLLSKILEKFSSDKPVTMTFRKGNFSSGHDLTDFASKLGIHLQVSDVEQ